jgi:Zn finger protein HypA/HybF involved in hydrogenase expression
VRDRICDFRFEADRVAVECEHCGYEETVSPGPWLCPACECCNTLFPDGTNKIGYYREVDSEWVIDRS